MENKKPRGEEIDKQLKFLLDKMIEEGYHLSPISLATVSKRLGLKSRSTLVSNSRSEVIKNAKKLQLKNAGLNESGKKRRNTLQEQFEECKKKLKQLEIENELLLKKMAEIMYNLNARGLDVEEIMKPLRF